MSSPSPSQVSNGSPKESAMSVDLFVESCTAAELGNRLMERFEGDKDQTVNFLRQCQKLVEQQDSENETEDNVDLGDPFLSNSIVSSMMSPRGKVSLEFYEGILRAMDVKTSTEAWRLGADKVSQIVVFPKPEDCKKALSKKSSDIALLHLKEPLPVRNQKKPVSQVSFALPTDLPTWKTPQEVLVQDSTVAWNQVLQRTFEKAKIVRVKHPEVAAPSAFTSFQADRVSTTSGGMPFVTCYHGTKDGVLFPLTDGSLLFHKPPFLIPAEEMEGITTGGRGAANSRYVDLVVQHQGETLEFTNVNRDEVEGLQKFLALASDSDAAVEIHDDNDEEEEQGAGGARKRSKRKASVDARRINKRIIVSVSHAEEDDEEDDIEYIAGTAGDEDEEGMDTEDDDDDDADDDDVWSDNEHDEVGDPDDQNNETEDETESEG